MEKDCIIFAGSYAPKEQDGIHGFCIKRPCEEKVQLEEIITGKGVSNPSYLTVSSDGKFLYSVMEDMTYCEKIGGGVASLKIEGENLKLLNTRATDGTLPCHILLDEQREYVFTANYLSGSVSMFPLEKDGSIGEMCDFHQHTGSGPNKERQENSHVHFLGFTADKKGIWAVDLGDDRIYCYQLDEKNSMLLHKAECDIIMPDGVGPRHFVLNSNNREIMYVICELSSEVYVVECKETGNRILQCISTLPNGVTNSTCAAIHISQDSRFLYASNRGDNSIAIFEINKDYTLKLIEITKTNGKTPRDFCIIDDLMLCANQDSDTITALKIDKNSGKLKNIDYTYSCKSPVCLVSSI